MIEKLLKKTFNLNNAYRNDPKFSDNQPSFDPLISERRGGLVVERRTPEREVGGLILTLVVLLYP